MRIFAVLYRYSADGGLRDLHRTEHRAFLADLAQQGVVLARGPLDGEPAGALIIVRADTAEQAAAALDDDPFLALGCITDRVVRAWTVLDSPWG